MAKISKRKENIMCNNKIYNAGIYARLSVERTEKNRDKSMSLETQELICRNYAHNNNINIISVYNDYEYSGTNFNRPAYLQMMEDVKKGKINCIIVKDLSRLGREHIEMGILIDKVFPILGVRFVSVNDNLDTKNGIDNNKSFEIAIKNIINELYAKDISEKVKATKENRALNGNFIGAFAPYGYNVIKNEDGSRRLVIDENTASIVKEIFEMSITMSCVDIAKSLNGKKITCPLVYKKTKRLIQNGADEQWNAATLGSLLNKEVYIGNTVAFKYSKNKNVKIVENTHDAIVTKELFNLSKKMRVKRLSKTAFTNINNVKIFDSENIGKYNGIIFTSSGTRMSKVLYSNKNEYAYRSNLYNGKNSSEKNYCIRECVLDKIIVEKLAEILKINGSKKLYLKKIDEKYIRKSHEIKNNIEKIGKSINYIKNKKLYMYEEYVINNISKEKYLLEKEKLSNINNGYVLELSKLNDDLKVLENNNKVIKNNIKMIFNNKNEIELNRENIKLLIKKITVFSKDKADVEFDLGVDIAI